jgi:hypothetical protein
MIQAIRMKRRIDSETLHKPELRPMLGKKVEIIILEDAEQPETMSQLFEPPLKGSVLQENDPFEPVAEDDWEALR